jgi:predicted transcriptional regulator
MSDQQVVLNEVGDVVVTEADMMLALADQERLRLLERLQRGGPATTVELAEEQDTSDFVILEQLQLLEDVGLVSVEDDRWQAVGRGLHLEVPDDPKALDAARRLYGVMLLKSEELPRHWVAETAHKLEFEWLRASGVYGAGVVLSPQELRDIQARLEELLAPYTNRAPEDAPAHGRQVRILSYFLPTARED